MGRGELSTIERSRLDPSLPRPRREFASISRSSDVSLGLILDFQIMGGFFLLCGSVRMHRNSADEALIVCEAFTEDDDTLGCNFILANILGMITAAHLDNYHDLAKPPIDGYVPQPDDVIAKKRDGVGAEWEFGKRLIHFNCAQNRHSDSCQSEDHPVERFTKIGAEARRQSHLKARQGIDHQPPGADHLYSVENRLHGFVHREIQGAEVEDREFPVSLRRFLIENSTGRSVRLAFCVLS